MKYPNQLIYTSIVVIFIYISQINATIAQIFPDPDGDPGTFVNVTKTIGHCDYKGETSPNKVRFNTTNRRYTFDFKFNTGTYQTYGATKDKNKESCEILDCCNPGWAKLGRISFHDGNLNYTKHKLNVGWKPDPEENGNIFISAYFHDYIGTNEFYVSHQLTKISTNSVYHADMFLGKEIIGLIINNYAIGIRKPLWHSGESTSAIFRTFYYGGPKKKCKDCNGNEYSGTILNQEIKKKVEYTNQSNDESDYIEKFNSCDYMTWNLTEFANNDNECFFATKEIYGSIPSGSLVSDGSGNAYDKQKCIITSGANISFQSGESIHLYKGFHAEKESNFHASICLQIEVSSPNIFGFPLCYEVVNASSGSLIIYFVQGWDTTLYAAYSGYFTNTNTICFGENSKGKLPPSEYKCVATFSNDCQSITRTDYYFASSSEKLLLVDSLTKTKKQIIKTSQIVLNKERIDNNQVPIKNDLLLKTNKMSVFPNPARNVISFMANDFESIRKVDIYSLQGELIYSKNKINEPVFTTYLDFCDQGLYFSHITTDKNIYNEKFYKIK